MRLLEFLEQISEDSDAYHLLSLVDKKDDPMPAVYPLPSDSKTYKNVDSKRRGGKRVKVRKQHIKEQGEAFLFWLEPQSGDFIMKPRGTGTNHSDLVLDKPEFFGLAEFPEDILQFSLAPGILVSKAIQAGYVRGAYLKVINALFLEVNELGDAIQAIRWAKRQFPKIDDVDIEMFGSDNDLALKGEQVDYVAMTGKLPLGEQARPQSDLAKLFDKTATAQRGEPEDIMVRLQFALGGGVYSFVIEHVGDLTHRMTEKFDFLEGSYLTVQDKVEKTYKVLAHRYGFEREHWENLKNNFDYYKERGQLPEALEFNDWVAHIKELSQKYADAHRQVPIFNDAQWHAREAAIALGEWRFSTVRYHLRWLLNLLQDEDQYLEWVSRVEPEYLRKRQVSEDVVDPKNVTSEDLENLGYWYHPQRNRLVVCFGTHTLCAIEELGIPYGGEEMPDMEDEAVLEEAVRQGWVRILGYSLPRLLILHGLTMKHVLDTTRLVTQITGYTPRGVRYYTIQPFKTDKIEEVGFWLKTGRIE